MNELILLKSGPVTDLASGELAIESVEGRLSVKTVRGVIVLPLDRMALEPRDDNASSEAYVWRDSGVAEITPLSAGGGAQSPVGSWRIPGLTPVSIAQLDLDGIHSVDFEVAEPTTFENLRLGVIANADDADVSIYNAASDLLYSHTISTTIGSTEEAISLTLDPGRYTMTVETSSEVSFEVVEGYSQAGLFAQHIVSMQAA